VKKVFNSQLIYAKKSDKRWWWWESYDAKN